LASASIVRFLRRVGSPGSWVWVVVLLAHRLRPRAARPPWPERSPPLCRRRGPPPSAGATGGARGGRARRSGGSRSSWWARLRRRASSLLDSCSSGQVVSVSVKPGELPLRPALHFHLPKVNVHLFFGFFSPNRSVYAARMSSRTTWEADTSSASDSDFNLDMSSSVIIAVSFESFAIAIVAPS